MSKRNDDKLIQELRKFIGKDAAFFKKNLTDNGTVEPITAFDLLGLPSKEVSRVKDFLRQSKGLSEQDVENSWEGLVKQAIKG